MANIIKCPHCGREVEVTEAFRQQIEVEVKTDVLAKHQQEIVNAKKEAEEKIRREIEEKGVLEITDLKRQVQEDREKIKGLREQELQLRVEKRRLEDKERELELEAQRKLDAERKNIGEKARLEAEEEYRYKDLESQKIIRDLKKSVDELRRKAQVGSQQLQGEVLELDLEEILNKQFPNDKIEPVEKGVKGADIRQIVKSPKGRVWGVILWESKRTKAWSDGWLGKLKTDLRREKADIPAIVSQRLPDEAKTGIGLKEGVWICSHPLIIPLAILLRKSILDVGYQKAISEHQGRKADLIYDFITGHEFRQQVETLVEVFQEMQGQLNQEKASFEKAWKQREKQLQRLLMSTAGIYGSIQGLAGTSAIPQLKGLDLPQLKDGNG
ncbi:MAG TPA: DUF2130 domain-containing protein [Candidatus Bathyarchaeia archaeon]|nr:DUF2130 domain-containing protein [Candidatus Bathyarchaeia archaeon]